jgi:hypothetical protein
MKTVPQIASLACALALLLGTVPLGLAQQSPAPSETSLLNGLKVLVFRNSDPVVSVTLRIHAGSSFDLIGKDGTMRLLTEVLLPTEELRSFLAEDFGREFRLSVNYDFIEIETGAPNDKILSLLETMAARVTNPEITRETTEAAKRIAGRTHGIDLDAQINQVVASRFLGNYPHGRAVNGSAESFARIDFADIAQARNRFLSPDNATLVISGDVDPGLMSRATRRLFGSWTRADQKPRWSFANPSDQSSTAEQLEFAGLSDGEFAVRMAVRNFTREDQRFEAYRLLIPILKDRLDSEFGNSSIEDRGHRIQGALIIGARTNDAGKLSFLSSGLLSPVTEEELRRSRNNLAGRQSSLATGWLDMDTYGFISPRIADEAREKVSVNDLNNVLEVLKSNPSMVMTFSSPIRAEASGQ